MEVLFKEIIAYIKAKWPRKSTLLILLLFSSILLLWIFSGIDLQRITKNQYLFGAILLIIITGIWIYSNLTPKVRSGKTGFAIGIKTDNPDQYLKIKGILLRQ